MQNVTSKKNCQRFLKKKSKIHVIIVRLIDLFVDKKRKVCRLCGAKVRTWCPEDFCGVGLCVGNCFQTYHTRATEE